MKGITVTMLAVGLLVGASGCATSGDKTAGMTKDQRAAYYTLKEIQHRETMGYNSLDNKRNIRMNEAALREPAALAGASKAPSNQTQP